MDAQPLHPARVGVQHLELELVRTGDELASRRHAAGERHDEPADGIDLLGQFADREVDAERLGDLLEAGARVGDEGVALAQDHAPRGDIVLVLDVADHHLDEVLDRDEAVRAAVFVDHQGHVGARRLHSDEEIDRRHRGWGEEHGPKDPGGRERHREVDLAEARRLLAGSLRAARPAGLGPRRDVVEEVADMNHALRVVEGLAEHRQARVSGGAEKLEQFAERRLERHRHDIDPRHHHVVDADAVEAEHVLQHRPLLRREVLLADLGERFLQVVADRIAGLQADARQQAVVPARPRAFAVGHLSDAGDGTSIIVHG